MMKPSTMMKTEHAMRPKLLPEPTNPEVAALHHKVQDIFPDRAPDSKYAEPQITECYNNGFIRVVPIIHPRLEALTTPHALGHGGHQGCHAAIRRQRHIYIVTVDTVPVTNPGVEAPALAGWLLGDAQPAVDLLQTGKGASYIGPIT